MLFRRPIGLIVLFFIAVNFCHSVSTDLSDDASRLKKLQSYLARKYGNLKPLQMWNGIVLKNRVSIGDQNLTSCSSHCDPASSGSDAFETAVPMEFSYSNYTEGCATVTMSCTGYGHVIILVDTPKLDQALLDFILDDEDTISSVNVTLPCGLAGWGTDDPNLAAINNEFTCSVTIPVESSTTTCPSSISTTTTSGTCGTTCTCSCTCSGP